jgi:hypothetical protein
VALDQVEHVRRPPPVQQVRGRPGPELPRQLRHEADVGELGAGDHVRAAAPAVADVALGHRVEAPVGEDGTLGCARGPGGQHDGDVPVRIFGKVGQSGALTGARAEVGQDVAPIRRRSDPNHHGVRLVDRPARWREHDVGADDLQGAAPFGIGEPGVDPGGDGPEPRQGQVGHDVGRIGGNRQRRHGARADPPVEEPDGGLGRQSVEVGEGHRPSGRGDEGRPLAVPTRRFGDQMGQVHARRVPCPFGGGRLGWGFGAAEPS